MTDYTDATLPIDARVADLLGRMSLAEKVGQLLQLDARGDLEEIVVSRLSGSILHASPEGILQAIELTQRTRLRVPLLIADDCIHGYSFWPGATIFGTQLALACAWDSGLVERVARATAVEASATGIHWTFSPVLCIARDPRWGRVGETFGEDPHLIGELAAAMVRGYQGTGLDDQSAILATAKHFAGYSETQGGRDASEADLSRRKLRSWFLPPFEKVAREGCATFMLGYQSMDGVPITQNRWLLQEVLKGEWGFEGTLVTDWDNVGRMVWEQQVCVDDVEAAIKAIEAGNDFIMTTPQFFEAAQQAVEQGRLDEELIDQAVARVLRLKFRLGLFEDPRPPSPQRQAAMIGCRDHQALNLEAARASLVLLRNDGALPLGPEPKTVAVLGPLADDAQNMLGDWAGNSGQVPWLPDGHPRELITTVLDGLRQQVPEDWSVTYARGAEIQILTPQEGSYPDGQPLPPLAEAAPVDDQMLAEAVAVARAADHVVVVVGDTVAYTGEGCSTATLELQGGQIALLDAVAELDVPTTVVLIQSKPSTLPDSALRGSLIEAFNPGMRGGQAIAELILGKIEPRGRLPISFPRHAGQLPVYYNQIRGQHGDRYADLTQEPLFAFGEGLSYTDVIYSDLVLDAVTVAADGVITGRVTLTNTGQRPAEETVQLYVRDLVTSVTWADIELKGFVRARVEPGASEIVEISLPASACSLVTADERRVVEPGEFELRVGPSSRRETHQVATFQVE